MDNQSEINNQIVDGNYDIFEIRDKRGEFEWLSQLNDNILKDRAYKSRKTMFMVSSAAIVVVVTGWIPTEFTPLGIKFLPKGQILLLNLFSIDIAYLLICFLVYAISDISDWYYSWRKEEYYQAEQALEKKHKSFQIREPGTLYNEIKFLISKMSFKIKVKHFLDIIFPVLISITAMISLFIKNYL